MLIFCLGIGFGDVCSDSLKCLPDIDNVFFVQSGLYWLHDLVKHHCTVICYVAFRDVNCQCLVRYIIG